MPRLIDADAFEANMQNEWELNEISNGDWILFREMINAEPTIEERKNGKWIHLGGDEWCCDQCGNVISTEGSWITPLHDEYRKYFCNICGADMRGEEDGSICVCTD